MEDRELLEWAAKAVGLKFSCFDNERQALKIAGRPSRWNPLNDDGDALRLAVKLRMCIDVQRNAVAVNGDAGGTIELCKDHKGDRSAAARRAIVRAAAEISKATAADGGGG